MLRHELSFPGIQRFGDLKWFWYYLWRRRFSPSFRSESSSLTEPHFQRLLSNIDKVPPEIIARLRADSLYAAAPACFKSILRLLLEKSNPASLPALRLRSEENRERIIQHKSIPRDFIDGAPALLLRHLASDQPGEPAQSSLFATDNNVSAAVSVDPSTDYAGMFVVDKSSTNPETGVPFKRLIVDARAANARLENDAPMSLFTLEALMERMAFARRKSPDAQIHCLSADLRHWFHQLPLPRHFRRHFVLRTKVSRGDVKLVFPRAWPMGVHCAPGIGQACTWSLLLSDLEGSSPQVAKLRETLSLPDPSVWSTPPSWLPLANGGAIFVLIDNIFIISPTKSTAEAWRARIVNCCNHFHAHLKREEGTDYSKPNKLDHVEFVSLHHKSANTIKFSGITFTGSGRSVANPPQPSLLPESDDDWEVPFRTLASILGQVLWCLRVRGYTMLDLSSFIELYRFASPPNNAWNSTTSLPSQQLAYLRGLYEECLRNEEAPYPEPVDIMEAEVFFGASDAEGGVNKGVGFVFKKLNDLNWHVTSCSEIPGHGEAKIALGELSAAISTLRAIFEKFPSSNPKLVMLAIDNQSVVGMISRGYSPIPEARTMLIELFSLLQLNQAKLYVSYIRSAANPADGPSRGKSTVESQLLDLEAVFVTLEPTAKAALLLTGKNRSIRPRQHIADPITQ